MGKTVQANASIAALLGKGGHGCSQSPVKVSESVDEAAFCCSLQGLGKTVQTIAFVAALLGKGGNGGGRRPAPAPGAEAELEVSGPSHDPRQRQPILILCPGSVIANWQREFVTWGE